MRPIPANAFSSPASHYRPPRRTLKTILRKSLFFERNPWFASRRSSPPSSQTPRQFGQISTRTPKRRTVFIKTVLAHRQRTVSGGKFRASGGAEIFNETRLKSTAGEARNESKSPLTHMPPQEGHT